MNYIVDFRFLGFVFIAGLHNIIAEELPDKIVGGITASPKEFPWIVTIRVASTGQNICAGVIYKENYIVTAAHCGCSNPNKYEVVAGEYILSDNDGTEQIRMVSNIKCHPDFDFYNTGQNDVAVWRLNSAVSLNNVSVKAAKLAQTGFIPADTVTVAGWGYTYAGGPPSNTLLKVTVPMVAYSKCSESYSLNQFSQLCAGAENKGSCVGDSGGPLHSDSTVCGITSYGSEDCGNPIYPGVYSNVAYFYNWISDNAI